VKGATAKRPSIARVSLASVVAVSGHGGFGPLAVEKLAPPAEGSERDLERTRIGLVR